MRPPSILVACADGNFYIARITWGRWNRTSASGKGTAHENDCTPTCVAGHFRLYPASVRLFRPEICRGSRLEFTRFTYTFVSRKPPGLARSATFKSPFFLGRGCP